MPGLWRLMPRDWARCWMRCHCVRDRRALPHRRRGGSGGAGLELRHDRGASRGRHGRELPAAVGRGRSDLAAAAAGAAAGRGGDHAGPDTVQLCADTESVPGTLSSPTSCSGLAVRMGAEAVIHSFCHLEHATVADRAEIGPVRPPAPRLRHRRRRQARQFRRNQEHPARSGGQGESSELSGRCTVGAQANIGAGTITCNYDGFDKHATRIGADAFIGSNTALVAPVSIGKGAIIGAGSVITGDVPDDGLRSRVPARSPGRSRRTAPRHLRRPRRG